MTQHKKLCLIKDIFGASLYSTRGNGVESVEMVWSCENMEKEIIVKSVRGVYGKQ